MMEYVCNMRFLKHIFKKMFSIDIVPLSVRLLRGLKVVHLGPEPDSLQNKVFATKLS
jgi:hypothetical protein